MYMQNMSKQIRSLISNTITNSICSFPSIWLSVLILYSIWNMILFLSLLPALGQLSFSVSFLPLLWKLCFLFLLFFQWLFQLVSMALCSSWVIPRHEATFSVYCYMFHFYRNSLFPAGVYFGPGSILYSVITAQPFWDWFFNKRRKEYHQIWLGLLPLSLTSYVALGSILTLWVLVSL